LAVLLCGIPVQAEDCNTHKVILLSPERVGPKMPTFAYMLPDKTFVWKLFAGIGVSDHSDLIDIFKLMEISGSTKLQIVLNNSGGSVFDGMAIAGQIQEKVKSGYTVEVRVYGIAASAATLILVSGSKDHRFVERNSLVMIHELSTFEFLSIKNVSEKEKEVKILRMIQDNLARLMAEMTGMKLEDLKKLCKEETWLTPEQAVRQGFADKVF